jgi:hypothetical protein
VPEPDEIGEIEAARLRAFEPLLQEARDLVATCEFPEPHIRVTADQYVRAITDAQIFSRLQDALAFGSRMSLLELADRQAIFGSTRRQLTEYLDSLSALRDDTVRLAWFEPPAAITRLRDLMLATGRHGLRLAVAMLEILTATSPAQAQAAGHDQQMLLVWPFSDELEQLLEIAEDLVEHDLDARIGIVLGTSGRFTDDNGFLDPARVFLAAPSGQRGIEQLSREAGRFFGHLISTAPDDIGAESVGLTLAALPLAAADRPFAGHRVARLTRDLLNRADATDPEATRRLVAGLDEDGARIFAGALRVQRDFQLLTSGQAIAADDVVVTVLRTYKTLLESSFRSLGTGLLGLAAIEAGQPVPADRPMLNELLERLRARAGAVGGAVADVVDKQLRNAEAHEDYRVEPDGSVVLLSANERLHIDDLAKKLDALFTTVVGLQAANLCFALDHGLLRAAPTWVRRGDIPAATGLVTRALFGLFGTEVVEMSVMNATATIRVAEAPQEPFTLLPLLVAVASLLEQVDVLEVLAPDGACVLATPTEPLLAFGTAPEDAKDLASLAPVFDIRVLAGSEKPDAAQTTLTLMLATLIAVDIPRLSSQQDAAASLRKFIRRTGFIRAFADAHQEHLAGPCVAVVREVFAARSAASGILQGRDGAFAELVAHLDAVGTWVDSQDLAWPPV